MSLKDTEIKHAKAKEKAYKLTDGSGLYLQVSPKGGKYWRFDYRYFGKRKTLALGVYPTTTLAQARVAHSAARQQLAEGIDPGYQKKAKRREQVIDAENSCLAIGTEWFGVRSKGWGADHTKRTKALLQKDIYPRIGFIPISQVSAMDVLDVVRAIEGRGALDMAEQALSVMGNILKYAVGTGRARANVADGMRQFLAPRIAATHHRHVSEAQLPELLRGIEGYGGRPETKIATKLIMLTFLRSNELRNGRWDQILWDKKEWHVPSAQMKGTQSQKASGIPHIVPLSCQAVKLLEELGQFTGNGLVLFPNINGDGKVMSNGTINKLLSTIGFSAEQTTHGFRGLASTLMNEKGGFNPDIIERQLAHKERNLVRRAYNHAQYLDERHRLMQWWADFLENRSKSSFETITPANKVT